MSRFSCRTGKRTYRSPEQAKRALTLIRRNPEGREDVPTRWYECQFPPGKHYHLTSQPEREFDVRTRHQPEPEPLTDTEELTRDRDTLEGIVRACIATGCGECMHSAAWGQYRIRRGMA